MVQARGTGRRVQCARVSASVPCRRCVCVCVRCAVCVLLFPLFLSHSFPITSSGFLIALTNVHTHSFPASIRQSQPCLLTPDPVRGERTILLIVSF